MDIYNRTTFRRCEIKWCYSGVRDCRLSAENIGDGSYLVWICLSCFEMFGSELPDSSIVQARCKKAYKKCRVCSHLLKNKDHADCVNWRPMSEAPKDATWIEAKIGYGDEKALVHWACDTSGEYQPSFAGWFRDVTDDNGKTLMFAEVTTVRCWRPIEKELAA